MSIGVGAQTRALDKPLSARLTSLARPVRLDGLSDDIRIHQLTIFLFNVSTSSALVVSSTAKPDGGFPEHREAANQCHVHTPGIAFFRGFSKNSITKATTRAAVARTRKNVE